MRFCLKLRKICATNLFYESLTSSAYPFSKPVPNSLTPNLITKVRPHKAVIDHTRTFAIRKPHMTGLFLEKVSVIAVTTRKIFYSSMQKVI